MKKWPIILVAITIAFLFSLGVHYVTANNSVESRVAQIIDKNSDIIRLQWEKKELCKWLGDYRHNDLNGICEKNTKKVLPTNEIE